MSCPDATTISQFLAGSLPVDSAKTVESHIGECADCHSLLAGMVKAESSVVPGAIQFPDDDPKLEPGARLGRYVVLDRLGTGGMSAVYAAYDPQLDRKVALKLLRGESATSGRGQRLLREGKLLAQLSHPNIVHVYDVDSP